MKEEIACRVSIKSICFRNDFSSIKPLKAAVSDRIEEDFLIRYTYNTNAIEGSTLTEQETYLLLKEDLPAPDTPMRFHLDAIGHKEAYLYMKSHAQNGVAISENEKSFRVIGSEEYQREDGKDDKFFTTKPFFDISQTEGRPVYAERALAFDQSKMLAAMIQSIHDKGIELIADNDVPAAIGGTYQDGVIHVRDDLELGNTMFGLALGSVN